MFGNLKTVMAKMPERYRDPPTPGASNETREDRQPATLLDEGFMKDFEEGAHDAYRNRRVQGSEKIVVNDPNGGR